MLENIEVPQISWPFYFCDIIWNKAYYTVNTGLKVFRKQFCFQFIMCFIAKKSSLSSQKFESVRSSPCTGYLNHWA